MNKYVRLEINYDFGYKRYISYGNNCDENDQFMYTLFWALEEFMHKDELIRFLDDPDWPLQAGNEGFMMKTGYQGKKENVVELYNPSDAYTYTKKTPAIPSATISIKNLKLLAKDWKRLYESNAPVIYLIAQEDGWIFLSETLDNES